MGAAASFDHGFALSTESNRYFCHSCHRVFGLDNIENSVDYYCPHCQSTFLEEIVSPRNGSYDSRVVHVIGGPTGLHGGSNNNSRLQTEPLISIRHRTVYGQLTLEQARRISNATAMLRLLELQLREELEHLQHAFETTNMRIDNVNGQQEKPKKLTKVMKSCLRTRPVNIDMACSQVGTTAIGTHYSSSSRPE